MMKKCDTRRYRPEDPLSHAVYGELHRTPANLLLKLTRPRKQPISSTTAATDETDQPETVPETSDVKAEVVARVACSYQVTG